MKRHIAWTLLVLLLNLADRPAFGQNASSPDPSATSPSAVAAPAASRDPYMEERKQAGEAERAWMALEERLGSDLASADPCQEVEKVIRAAKDAAFKALSLKAEYYRKHLEHHQNTSASLAKVSADRAGLRQEIERDLRAAERMQTEIEQRRQNLATGERSDAGLNSAQRALNQLLNNTAARVENLRAALLRWNEAEDYTRQARELAHERAEAVRQAQLLLLSENSLWDSYYDSRLARHQLTYLQECEEFTPFATRSAR
jgi:chromosome segregation ATPase